MAQHIVVTRVSSLPPGMTHIAFSYSPPGSGIWNVWFLTSDNPYDFNFGASGAAVRVKIAWSDGMTVSSEESDVKTVTTL